MSPTSRTTAQREVRLDGVANDGSAGENDFVKADVEGAVGGTAGDTLIGNTGDNFLQGLDGADTITGANGEDALCGDGTASSDSYFFGYCELSSGGAADNLNGGNGDDQLSGGGGADVLDGGAGARAASTPPTSARGSPTSP